MNQSQQIDQLDLALMALRQEFGVIIPKDCKGHNAKYATLPAILEWLEPKAFKHNLALAQGDGIKDGRITITSLVTHVPSEQYRSCQTYLMPDANANNEMMAWGGATTYHRRYQAMMLFGVFQEEDPSDNDGQSNGGGTISQKQIDLYLRLAAQAPDKAATIAKKYPDPAQIPWKAFQDVLAFMDPEKYKKQ